MDGISPPGALNLRAGDLSSEWRKWIRAFQDYLLAIDVTAETVAAERRKLALFRTIGGEDVRELYSQMEFLNETDPDNVVVIREGAEGRRLEEVITRFTDYCNPRSSIIVQRLEFHNCKQNGEQLDVFLMRLRRLAEGCDFGTQRDGLIRDKLLFGLDDVGLRDRLMREADDRLTLEYVVKAVRVDETAKLLRNTTLGHSETNTTQIASGTDINFVQRGPAQRTTGATASSGSVSKCNKCGKFHGPRKCPAYNTKCRRCDRLGHWANFCKDGSGKKLNVGMVTEEEQVEPTVKAPGLFLDTVVVINSVEAQKAWYSSIIVDCGQGNQTVRFKLDTGAALTVCGPGVLSGEVRPTVKSLYGPGMTKLHCLGVVDAELLVGNRQFREEIYIVENQRTPLLSRNACERLNLVSMNQSLCDVSMVQVNEKLFDGLGRVDTEYGITLKQEAKPFALCVPRPIPFPLREKADIALSRMETAGVIVKVKDPTEWVAPMVVVPKSNKQDVRICTDFTELNKFVIREVHPMATVESSLASLGAGKVFSKIDANSGFWQIPLKESSSYLTTFLTHRGRYRYLRLPQGLCSAPEIFQSEMNRILDGIEGVIIHMDDVLVYGGDREQHDVRLEIVLRKLGEAGMTLNKGKCQFGLDTVEFLGYRISQDGIQAGQRVQGIVEFPVLGNVKAVQSFLGLVNQYARFSSKIAELSRPLRELLRKDVVWHWGDAQRKAFAAIKEEFVKPPVLAPYRLDKETIVTTDASGAGVGATLSQIQDDGARRLVAAASRSLTEAESKYAAIEKEALAVCWAMEKFSQYVLGMDRVIIETDHKPLIPLLNGMFLDRLPSRIQRFKLRLQRFQYMMRHISGKSNVVADALSRYTSGQPTGEDVKFLEEVEFYVQETLHLNASDTRLETLRIDQSNDETLSQVMKFVQDGWPAYLSTEDSLLKPYFERRSLLTVSRGLLLLGDRLVIPLCQRCEVLCKLHEGHLGVSKCRDRARHAVWWPFMNKAIEEMIGSCVNCAKESRIPKEPLRPVTTPARPWEMVGSDLFMLNNENYLMVVDYYSRYPEVAHLGRDTSAQHVIDKMKEIFARHGIPDYLVSDNGPQYSSSLFTDFVRAYDFKHITSSPRYPRSNGAAERMVQTVKNLMRKSVGDPCLALLSYRASPVISSYSPAELLMGRKLRTTVVCHPDNLLPATVDHEGFMHANDNYKAGMKESHDTKYVRPLRPVDVGERVMFRGSNRALRDGTIVSTPNEATRQQRIKVEDTGNLIIRNRSAVVTPRNCPQQISIGREPPTVALTRSGRPVRPRQRLIEED